MNKCINSIGVSEATLNILELASSSTEHFKWTLGLPGESQNEGDNSIDRITVFNNINFDEAAPWARKAMDAYVQPLLILGSGEEVPDFGEEDDQGCTWRNSIMTLRIGKDFPDTIEATRALIRYPDADYVKYWRGFLWGPGRKYPQNNPLVFGGEFPRVYAQALSSWLSGSSNAAAHIRKEINSECGAFDRSEFALVPTSLGDARFRFDLRAHPDVGLIIQDGNWSTNGLLPPPDVIDPANVIRRVLSKEIQATVLGRAKVSKQRATIPVRTPEPTLWEGVEKWWHSTFVPQVTPSLPSTYLTALAGTPAHAPKTPRALSNPNTVTQPLKWKQTVLGDPSGKGVECEILVENKEVFLSVTPFGGSSVDDWTFSRLVWRGKSSNAAKECLLGTHADFGAARKWLVQGLSVAEVNELLTILKMYQPYPAAQLTQFQEQGVAVC